MRYHYELSVYLHTHTHTQVHLHRDKVIWPGAKIQKPGEGMPNYEDNTRKGNLYITVDVDFPRGIFSSEDKEGEL